MGKKTRSETIIYWTIQTRYLCTKCIRTEQFSRPLQGLHSACERALLVYERVSFDFNRNSRATMVIDIGLFSGRIEREMCRESRKSRAERERQSRYGA